MKDPIRICANENCESIIRKEQRVWNRGILTFRKTAENAANLLRNGSLVGIDGRINPWTGYSGGKMMVYQEIPTPGTFGARAV
jgi:single-stranded DNA-binding protein